MLRRKNGQHTPQEKVSTDSSSPEGARGGVGGGGGGAEWRMLRFHIQGQCGKQGWVAQVE